MQKLSLAFAKYLQPSAYSAADYGFSALNNQITPDYKGMYDKAGSDIDSLMGQWSDVQRGIAPQALQDARINSINYGLDKTIGTKLNDAASKGILNSSVTKGALAKVGEDAMNTLNTGYADDLSNASQLINQGSQMALLPMTTAATSQEAAMNAPMKYLQIATGNQAPATDSWKTLMSARYSLKSNPTAVVTEEPNIFGGLMSGVGAFLGCFAADTVISSGKNTGTAICALRKGDKVIHGNAFGEDGEAIVTDVYPLPEKQVPVMISTPRRYLVTTKSQTLFLLSEGVVRVIEAQYLKIGDVVLTIDGAEQIRFIRTGTYPLPVYDIDIDKEDNRFYAGGFLVEGLR